MARAYEAELITLTGRRPAVRSLGSPASSQSGGEFVFRFNWDISSAVLLGETLGLDDALLSGPGEALYPVDHLRRSLAL